jgi:hypothetical protein
MLTRWRLDVVTGVRASRRFFHSSQLSRLSTAISARAAH